jgi:hypothetical protein
MMSALLKKLSRWTMSRPLPCSAILQFQNFLLKTRFLEAESKSKYEYQDLRDNSLRLPSVPIFIPEVKKDIDWFDNSVGSKNETECQLDHLHDLLSNETAHTQMHVVCKRSLSCTTPQRRTLLPYGY